MLQITNTDGTTQVTSYDGCGCSGNQVTTIEGELVPVPGTSNSARRKQKIYQDLIGRTVKTETFEWDGSTVYTTVINKHNGRDQVLETQQFAGGTGGVHQDVVMTYDGHGRMLSRHYPIENAGASTSWSYNVDDTVQAITDPRGSVTSYAYGLPYLSEKRALVTNIAYTPSSGVPDSPDVSFVYDNMGQRTSMTTAGVAQSSYSYNNLSQIVSETLDLDDSGIPNYTVAYTYHVGGGLKSVTDPFGKVINYTNDKTGRLTQVSGTPFGENTTGNYADSIQYRAFGQVKSMVYRTNDNATVSMQYDSRLRVSQHQVATSQYAGGFMKKATFSYYADSRPKEMDNIVDGVFDRNYEYDFAGRLTASSFGIYTSPQGQQLNPHSQNVTYDSFSQLTFRESEQWGLNGSLGRSYTNGRLNNNGGGETLTYDASGNILYQGVSANSSQSTTFDASGRQTGFTERWILTGVSYDPIISERTMTSVYDGDGRYIKGVSQTNRLSSPQTTGPVTTDYEIFSTVLGTSLSQVVFESGSEVSRKTSVYAGGAVIAEQRRLLGTDTIVYMHADPVTGSKQEVSQSGQPFSGLRARVEYEPLGQRVRINPPFEEPPPPSVPPAATGDAKFMEWQCTNSQRLGHSFRELPMHCKQALLENVALSRGDIFGSPKEGNPGRISEKNGIPPTLKLADKKKKAANKALAATEKFAEGDNETVIGYGVPTVPGFVEVGETAGEFDGIGPRSGPCDLHTPAFLELTTNSAKAASALLVATYGERAAAIYASWGTYRQAVFLNTIGAVVDQGVDLSAAKLADNPFYYGNSPDRSPFGIEVTGVNGSDLDKVGLGDSLLYGRRSPRAIKEGSIEATVHGGTIAFDVDLYNVKSNKVKHADEVAFNRDNKTTTHPADVVRKLNGRGVKTGVICR